MTEKGDKKESGQMNLFQGLWEMHKAAGKESSASRRIASQKPSRWDNPEEGKKLVKSLFESGAIDGPFVKKGKKLVKKFPKTRRGTGWGS